MQTLTKGYLKPDNTDTGDLIFPALAQDIQQLNDHTHNGVDSQPLASVSQTILPGTWVAVAGISGLYRQAVTVPVNFTYDQASLWFKLSTGEVVYPSVERIDATHFYVYTNDNSLTYTAYFR